MITEEELDGKVQDIQEKFKYLEQELESLYQAAEREGLHEFAKRIERIQFSDYFNPSQWCTTGVPFDFKIFYDILKENEASKVNPTEVLELRSKLNRIGNIIKD